MLGAEEEESFHDLPDSLKQLMDFVLPLTLSAELTFNFTLNVTEGKLVEFDIALSRKSVGIIKPQLKPREYDGACWMYLFQFPLAQSGNAVLLYLLTPANETY